jgi:hypothetical protein
MTPNTTPDPVNRWATEHYGFEDAPTPQAPPLRSRSGAHAAPRPRTGPGSSRPRRRSTLLAGGVLSVLLGAAGFGGFTMAANAADAGPDGVGRGATVTNTKQGDRFDDGGPDAGGIRGGPDNGAAGDFGGGPR